MDFEWMKVIMGFLMLLWLMMMPDPFFHVSSPNIKLGCLCQTPVDNNKKRNKLWDYHILPASVSSCLQSSALRLFIHCFINPHLSSCKSFLVLYCSRPPHAAKGQKLLLRIDPYEFGMLCPHLFFFFFLQLAYPLNIKI